MRRGEKTEEIGNAVSLDGAGVLITEGGGGMGWFCRGVPSSFETSLRNLSMSKPSDSAFCNNSAAEMKPRGELSVMALESSF